MKVLLVLLLGGFLTGCSDEHREEKQREVPIIPIINQAWVHYSGSLSTCEFEGHKYVLYSFDRGCGIVHHPDCKCKERKEK